MVTESVSVRISDVQLQEVESISKQEHKKKSETFREVLEQGIRSKKIEIALRRFAAKEATAWKAARWAGLPLTSFLDILKEKGILFHYSREELEEDFKGLG